MLFLGDQCEKCKPGFYGDKCTACECPTSDPANNFADSCSVDLDSNLLICQCKDGYAGSRCEKCADGFYGEPNKPGGSCKKCLCNGNIDSELKGTLIFILLPRKKTLYCFIQRNFVLF